MSKFLASIFKTPKSTPAKITARRLALATLSREERDIRNQYVAYSDRTNTRAMY